MRSIVLALLLAACHHTPEPAALSDVFAGTKAPTLDVPALKGVDWKMAISGAQPTLALHASSTLSYAVVGTATGQLQEIDITTTAHEDAEAVLTSLWGKPVRTTRTGDGLHAAGAKVWYGDHVMAELVPANAQQDRVLVLRHFIPLAEQLGTGTNLLGFERGASLIGASLQDIMIAYKDVLQDPGGGRPTTLAFLSDELSSLHVVMYFNPSNVVEAIQFYVHMETPLSDARQALLTKRFGPLTGDALKKGMWANHEVSIITSDDPSEMWSVTIRVAPPAAVDDHGK